MNYKNIALICILSLCSLSSFAKANTAATALPILIAAGSTTISFNATPLLSQSTDGGHTWSNVPASSLPKMTELNSVSCTGSGSDTICVTIGMSNNPSYISSGVLSQTQNNGKTWSSVTPSNIPRNTYLSSVSCTGSGDTAVCVAAGQDDTNPNLPQPLLVETTNGGATWSAQTITNSGTASGFFNAVSCTGTGATAICVAGGNEGTGQGGPSELLQPLQMQSINGGQSWSVITPTTKLPQYAGVSATSCTGSGSTAICVIAGSSGYTSSGSLQPQYNQLFLEETKNGGATWSSVTGNNFPQLGSLSSAYCSGKGANAICFAVGGSNTLDNNASPAIILRSSSGGRTWSMLPVSNMPNNGNFNSVNCSGTGNTAFCTAAGLYWIGTIRHPLLAQSTDGGQTWSAVTSNTLPTVGFFNSTNCIGSGSDATCIAVGGYSTGTGGLPPLLMKSTDDGKTWSIDNTTKLADLGAYTATASSNNS